MANTNCLKGIKCPHCGSEGPFRISATAWFVVYDNGTESHEDVEWDDDSSIVCVACHKVGTVGQWTKK